MAITRRKLIFSGLAAGGGLIVYSASKMLDTGGDGDARIKFSKTTPESIGLNAWIKIDPDGHITFAVHRAEMGQGVTTSIPMMLAEELDADWDRISYEFPPIDKDYYNFGVMGRALPFGDTQDRPLADLGTKLMRRMFHARGDMLTLSSTSILDAHYTIRPAAAAARLLLLQAAANEWDVTIENLVTEKGFVIDPDSDRRLGYGDLVEVAAKLETPQGVQPKDPSQYNIVGTSPPRLDIPGKVNGSAEFSSDVQLPNMLFGSVTYPPIAGAKLESFDARDAASVTGVEKIVQLGNAAVGVLANNSWAAIEAAKRIKINSVSQPDPVESSELLARYYDALDAPEPSIFVDEGDALGLIQKSESSFTATYDWPYLAHACMEPMNCTAWFKDGHLTIWAPTQAINLAQQVAASSAGLEFDQVTAHRVLLGGGFGRRAEMDFIERAAEAAMLVQGRPVKMIYSREQDVLNDMYRPAGVARLQAYLKEDGRIDAFNCDLVTQSVVANFATRTPTPQPANASRDKTVAKSLYDFVYDVPNHRVAFSPQNPHIPVGYWRSTATSYGAFCSESFVDELAHRANMDPLEFRLLNLATDDPRRAVLNMVADKSNWGEPLPKGRGRGIALFEKALTLLAQVAEVTVAEDGSFSIDRIVCVIDPGQLIHPDTVIAMAEGGIIFGVNAAINGEITFKDGIPQQSNFNNYRQMPMARMPEIEVHLMAQGERPEGVGETSVPGVAPAVANAIFSATGKRIRSLPFGERIDL
ncbi:MAG: molybdopterin cofactor-binding domain-containing protein [Pseudomonadota bacterium]|nr:molybdopterin cofactor-binding domain-containing protein [Pseudomonadota bacterium]